MKHLFTFLLIFLLLQVLPKNAIAESAYVLPYPSVMPGTILYKAHLVLELFQQFWYYGDFGQFKYNLKQADKYLVEAKTLFEYKQYLLAVAALEKSNIYFEKIPKTLELAEKHKKNIFINKHIFQTAALKHKEVILKLLLEVPESYTWRPEKEPETVLELHNKLTEALLIRKKYE